MSKKFLKNMKIFSNLSDEQIETLHSLLDEKSYLQGDNIYDNDSVREGFYILKSGSIELYREINNKNVQITIISSGEFMGEAVFLNNEPHSVSARANSDVLVLLLDNNSIKELEEKHVELYYVIIKSIAKIIHKRLTGSNTKMIHLTGRNLYFSGESRMEHDLLGERDVPEDALYGIQTLRAMENFSITKIPLSHYPQLIKGLAYIKKAAAMANYDLGLLEKNKKKAIVQVCDEILLDRHLKHFIVDMIQGGAGTSTNMNINEVIANRGLEIMGHKRGEYQYLHPNSDINMAQSTNDVYPSAIRLGILLSYKKLKKSMSKLSIEFLRKSEKYQDVIKVGRTQLQDAVPMTLGQEFKVWGGMIQDSIEDINYVVKSKLSVLNMGGTAIGTGLTADPSYANLVLLHLRELTGIEELKTADDLIQATQDTSNFVSYSSVLKILAVKLSKISNDLRLLSSGPRAGLNEINLPAVQPGSTIMAGKVNPVIPEVVNQVAFQVIGNDLTISLASEAGQLELNAMEPVIAFDLFQSQDILINAMNTLRTRAIKGITANKEVCRKQVFNSISLVTALNPYIGYENATYVAKIALKTGREVIDIILEEKIMDKETLDKLITPDKLIKATRKIL